MITVLYDPDGGGYDDISGYVMSGKFVRNKDFQQNTFSLKLDPTIMNSLMTNPLSGQLVQFKDGSDIVFSGMISGMNFSKSKNVFLEIKGADASMDLFSNQIPYSYTDELASDIIVDLVSLYNGNDLSDHRLTATLTTSGGYITPTTQTIDSFSSSSKRFYDALLELSIRENTDGVNQFGYYVDGDNKLHFEPTGTSTSYVDYYDFLDASVGLNTIYRFNSVFLDCGEDLNGDRIVHTNYDTSTYAKFGGRIVIKYFDESQLAAKIIKENPTFNNTEVLAEVENEAFAIIRKYLLFYGLIRKELQFTVEGRFNIQPNNKIRSPFELTTNESWVVSRVSQNFNINGHTTDVTMEEVIV